MGEVSPGVRLEGRQTYAVIDLDAIRSNVFAVRRGLGGTEVAAIVKADAYGHGSVETARAALDGGASMLGVALAEEAAPLREAGIEAPILVIGPSNPGQTALGVRLGLELCAFARDQLQWAQWEAERQRRPVRVHLKADTGMGRIGIRSDDELEDLLSTLERTPLVEVAGLFTHFSCADSGAEYAFSDSQHERFVCLAERLGEAGYRPKLHASNSAAIQTLPAFDHDMVRLGISMYGYGAAEAGAARRLPLQPAMQVWTEISHVKDLARGEAVGYGATYRAERPMRVATVQIGYGDGYNRLLSNRGRMIVSAPDGPRYVPVVGRVCMDMTMLDVTDVPGLSPGDPVMVMGRMGDLHFGAEDMAQLCGTISYEILLGYTARVPRLYTGGGV